MAAGTKPPQPPVRYCPHSAGGAELVEASEQALDPLVDVRRVFGAAPDNYVAEAKRIDDARMCLSFSSAPLSPTIQDCAACHA